MELRAETTVLSAALGMKTPFPRNEKKKKNVLTKYHGPLVFSLEGRPCAQALRQTVPKESPGRQLARKLLVHPTLGHPHS